MKIFEEYYTYTVLDLYISEAADTEFEAVKEKMNKLIAKEITQQIEALQKKIERLNPKEIHIEDKKVKEDLIKQRKAALKDDLKRLKKMLNRVEGIAKKKQYKYDFEPFKTRIIVIEKELA